MNSERRFRSSFMIWTRSTIMWTRLRSSMWIEFKGIWVEITARRMIQRCILQIRRSWSTVSSSSLGSICGHPRCLSTLFNCIEWENKVTTRLIQYEITDIHTLAHQLEMPEEEVSRYLAVYTQRKEYNRRCLYDVVESYQTIFVFNKKLNGPKRREKRNANIVNS